MFSKDVELLPLKLRPRSRNSDGCRGYALGSYWLFMPRLVHDATIEVGISPPATLFKNSRPPRLPIRETLPCAISHGSIEREAFKCTSCAGILEKSLPPYCPLRASLQRRGRTSTDEAADQSLRSSIRIFCESSLAGYRMLAVPRLK